MLYFFYGKNTKQARRAVRDTVAALLKKEPDAPVKEINGESFSPHAAEELLFSRGLFGAPGLFFLDAILESEATKTYFKKNVKRFQESKNVFVMLERVIDADTKRKITNAALDARSFEDGKSKGRDAFTMFPLVDAFGACDRKKAWMHYQEALYEGSAPEQIHGMLMWGLKNMLLAENFFNQEKRPNVPQKAPLKPFLLKKNGAFIKNYTRQDLVKMSAALTALYHDAHRGKIDLAAGLELFILRL